ncbi:NAD(P)/FAD-dependent oxidoreductase [Streptomyces sp. NPDC057445]|uniref:NAD(P)/FAD-dependent oxidoreductase n=1 Tax=Streptomyces sp. NPDC057445 TaxID=3346136 RepID=UPI00368D3FF7
MRRAIVMGGSFAGLLAARVVSEFVDEVVILEPDELLGAGLGRGAPHRQQLHALLSMGHAQLERWFPGITRNLLTAGAQVGTGDAVQFYVDGTLKPPVPDSLMIGATRPLIENHVRQRVVGLPNVVWRVGLATGIRFTGSRVSGVRFTTRDGHSSVRAADCELGADLVVDAMGRASRLSSWLDDTGWDAPPVDRMRIDLGYATATFHRPASQPPPAVIAHSTPGPASAYQPTICEPGALAAVEGNRWSVVLAGYADYRPSADPDEFLARMRRCVAPIRSVANECVMDGDVHTFHFRESQRRNFMDLARFPGGLVAVGDSVASVNPIYGQGLTLAALQASSLFAHLRSGVSPHQAAWGYFRRAGVVVDAAWQVSATADLAQPHVKGPSPRGYRLLRWAGDKITAASVIDPLVNKAFMDVVHMREHPRALTRPSLLLRAARATVRPPRVRATPPLT